MYSACINIWQAKSAVIHLGRSFQHIALSVSTNSSSPRPHFPLAGARTLFISCRFYIFSFNFPPPRRSFYSRLFFPATRLNSRLSFGYMDAYDAWWSFSATFNDVKVKRVTVLRKQSRIFTWYEGFYCRYEIKHDIEALRKKMHEGEGVFTCSITQRLSNEKNFVKIKKILLTRTEELLERKLNPKPGVWSTPWSEAKRVDIFSVLQKNFKHPSKHSDGWKG